MTCCASSFPEDDLYNLPSCSSASCSPRSFLCFSGGELMLVSELHDTVHFPPLACLGVTFQLSCFPVLQEESRAIGSLEIGKV
jgi:hypothetical protein